MNQYQQPRHRLAKLKGVACTFRAALTSDPVIVLNYHRIHAPTSEANNLTVSTDHFRYQMKYLKEHCQVISLRNIHEAPRDFYKNRFFEKRRVAITFDDGYADTLTHALPVLDEYGIPASVFISSNLLGSDKEFWWDEVEDFILASYSDADFLKLKSVPPEILFEPFSKTLLCRAQIYQRFCYFLKHSPLSKVHEVLAEMRSISKRPIECRDTHRSLTVKDLKDLSKNPLIEIGAHTLDHLCMSDLSYEEQYWQISESKKKIEELIGQPVTSFAYPYGERGDFNSDSFVACEKAGIQTAYTTVPGLMNQNSYRYAVPRMFVKNWGYDEFKKKLVQFFWTGRA